MNVQKYNENKLKAKKHIIFRYHLTSKMKRRNYECIKLKGIITFQWLRKMQMKIITFINVLGLRRVKMTVNQDDPSMYHLFYGDKTGSPGTELSFLKFL